jgi:hypothetical protein
MSYELVGALQKEAVTITQSCHALRISRARYYDTLSAEQSLLLLCAPPA